MLYGKVIADLISFNLIHGCFLMFAIATKKCNMKLKDIDQCERRKCVFGWLARAGYNSLAGHGQVIYSFLRDYQTHLKQFVLQKCGVCGGRGEKRVQKLDLFYFFNDCCILEGVLIMCMDS